MDGRMYEWMNGSLFCFLSLLNLHFYKRKFPQIFLSPSKENSPKIKSLLACVLWSQWNFWIFIVIFKQVN
jgi:hypothetical protein